ncbi:MAG: type IV toxin-antitoxin system AbiEi family antitoxin domain-containing protein [Verrucomicrobia bacterium]|jgi:predicted transcriptional regulator of viral defense system|nr:type IV toxin-antitoxin system AbiEi family antitoxin domain-containing protein [Verrucomicrobiota bacterium]
MTETDQILDLVKRLGLVRPKDLNQHGIPVIYLRRLLHRGELVQPARGVYAVTGHEPTLHHSLAMVSKRIPRGVVCLLSALAYHDIGTQLPSVVWLAIDQRSRPLVTTDLPAKIVRFSAQSLVEGVEEHSVEGVTVRITNPAKTVADCFKFRNKVGLDIALEALRDAWRKRKVTMVELDRFAATNRVTNVMRPYLEMLT